MQYPALRLQQESYQYLGHLHLEIKPLNKIPASFFVAQLKIGFTEIEAKRIPASFFALPLKISAMPYTHTNLLHCA